MKREIKIAVTKWGSLVNFRWGTNHGLMQAHKCECMCVLTWFPILNPCQVFILVWSWPSCYLDGVKMSKFSFFIFFYSSNIKSRTDLCFCFASVPLWLSLNNLYKKNTVLLFSVHHGFHYKKKKKRESFQAHDRRDV